MEQKIANISGTARPAGRKMPWLKKPEDARPCTHAGCANEGLFIPYTTVWAANDPDHRGRYVVSVIQARLCAEHATQDPAEYVPDAATVKYLTEQLGGEPDLTSMVVQFVGNSHCNVSYAEAIASAAAGAWEHFYDNVKGRLMPRKVGG